MNLVITLPTDLIAAILDKKKSIEIRSKLPINFDTQHDVVYVCQKGFQRVPIYFTIKDYIVFGSSYANDEKIANNASVPVKWIIDYREGRRFVYAWVIGYVCEVASPENLWHDLQLKSNPQSYVYSTLEWKRFSVLNCFASSQVNYTDMENMMHPLRAQLKWLTQQKKAIQ